MISVIKKVNDKNATTASSICVTMNNMMKPLQLLWFKNVNDKSPITSKSMELSIGIRVHVFFYILAFKMIF